MLERLRREASLLSDKTIKLVAKTKTFEAAMMRVVLAVDRFMCRCLGVKPTRKRRKLKKYWKRYREGRYRSRMAQRVSRG